MKDCSKDEIVYLGHEEQGEPACIWLSRRLMRIADDHTDQDARAILYFAAGFVAATK